MEHDLVCFHDGSKATKSFVAFCVSHIKMMVAGSDGWPVILHLIELSRTDNITSAAEFSPIYLRRLTVLGILIQEEKHYRLNPVFRHVLLIAEAQNNIYQTVFDKLVFDKDPETSDAESPETPEEPDESETEDKPPRFIIFGMEPLFKKLTFTFEYYSSSTGAYSNIDYKPDTEFTIPETVIGFLKSIE
jgi:hypothetical protein